LTPSRKSGRLAGAADGAFLLQKEKRTDGTATLDVVGRDQQDQRLYLTKDKEHLTVTQFKVKCEQERLAQLQEAAVLAQAKPLWAKIVKVLRSLYRAYCDLKSKFERLQADYGQEVSKNSSLSERIYEVCAERDSLKGKVRDYGRVRRAIGPEQADRILTSRQRTCSPGW